MEYSRKARPFHVQSEGCIDVLGYSIAYTTLTSALKPTSRGITGSSARWAVTAVENDP